MAKAANVTKFDAGGSGDNYIKDGYIRTVEKVWVDTYAFTEAIPSGTTLAIAKIPKDKKVTDVQLTFPALSTGASGTGTTISIGKKDSEGTTNNTLFLEAGEAATGIRTLSANQGIADVMEEGENTIELTFGRIATTTTAGTITSIVKYT